MNYSIREFEEADLPSLIFIYQSAIRNLGNEYYSDEQIAEWSSFADDISAFENWITKAVTYVAIDNQQACIGFSGFEKPARISSLFVSPKRIRKGIGSALLRRIFEVITSLGISDATTEASEFSKPLFEKFGFQVKNIELTKHRGITIPRYAMELHI